MEEYGTVTEVKGGMAIVLLEKGGAGKNCGGCCLCKKGREGNLLLETNGYEGIQKGDRVKIELDETAVLRGIIFLYGIPLVGFLLAVWLARMVPVPWLKTAVFLSVCIFAWLAGLSRGNAEGKRKRARIVKL